MFGEDGRIRTLNLRVLSAMLWIPLSYVPIKNWPVVSGQWSASELRKLITDHRPLTTVYVYSVVKHRNGKERLLRRILIDPGVTAPKRRGQG